MKSFHDDEALVTAHEEGKGKYCNMVGSLVCVSRTGAMFKVGSGLTDSMRSKVRKSYIQINHYSTIFFSYIYLYLIKIQRDLLQHQVLSSLSNTSN